MRNEQEDVKKLISTSSSEEPSSDKDMVELWNLPTFIYFPILN